MFRLILSLVLAGSLALPAAAQEARQLLNGMRSEAGLPGLSPSNALEQAALAHANDMANKGYFSHTGSDGSKVGTRAKRQGYDHCRIAENIAYGQTSVGQVIQTWATSRPHRRNILRRDFREYGLARAPGNIWVLVLGGTTC